MNVNYFGKKYLCQMKRVHELTAQENQDLTDGYKNGKKHHFRIRCQIILMSNSNLSVAQIANRLKKDKDTIYTWLKKYETLGIKGLQNKTGQGVKAPLDSITKQQLEILKNAVANEPQNLNKVCGELSDKFGFKLTKWMLIRYLKKNSIILGGESENG